MLNLETPIEQLPRIGAAYQKRLKRLGIATIKDLLFYFPSRYEDFSNIVPIKKVRVGYVVCVKGKVIKKSHYKTFKKWMDITEITIEDDTGSIKAVWFNQPYLASLLKENDFICLAGKISLGKDGIYLNNPAYEKFSEISENHNFTHTGRIVPIYPETRGLTSRWLRFIIKSLLFDFYNKIPEILPLEIIKKYKFLPIKKAIWQAHFPDSFEGADAAKARFSFEELFLLQLSVLNERFKLMQKKASAYQIDVELMKEFTKSLPFQLTDSQKQCSWQILKDLEKTIPMSRLLEGDVGSGKTVVATMAALNIVKGNSLSNNSSERGQVAFMAPTEILAKQHFQNIAKLLSNFHVVIGLLTGKESKIFKDQEVYETKKQGLLEDLKNGQIDILIGTHSLIQKNIEFKNLSLLVVDEQHRFGVEQRANLTKINTLTPHLLSMTATPIPRTLALSIYGDLDLSLINQMPKNRKKIKTSIIEPRGRKEAYEFIRKEVQEGKGVFVICPKIEPKIQSPDLKIDQIKSGFFRLTAINEIKAVKEEYEKLSKEIFPDLRITMLYGKMKPKEKERIMQDFQKGEIDILVSTSVVEVGVDISRATVIMIEGAERFGLAQLHQLRGRVGRADMQSYCFLFTTSPDQLNRKRLKALVDSDNGFELAQKDLEIRGPGQLYGSQQWGIPDIAMESLSNLVLVEKTRTEAKKILETDPNLENHLLLKERLKSFKNNIHFE